MSTNSYMVDERELEFVLFEHLDFDALLKLPAFSEVTKDTCKDILNTTFDLCREVLGPLNKVGDREGCKFNKDTFDVTTPPGFREAYKQYTEAGYLMFTASQEHGGLGMPHVIGACVAEQFTAANAAFTMYPGLTRSAAHLLEKHGEDWMRNICLPRMYDGSWAGTMALTEPAVGTAVGDLVTRATPSGDHFLLDGVKQWISGGEQDLTDNIMHLVLGRIEGAPPGIKGVSLFLVPKFTFDLETGEHTGRNDVKCIGIEEKMGIHGNSTCLLKLGDEGKCVGYLVGEPNQGISYMFLMMNEARMGVGIQGLALASVAFLNAQEYASGRIQGVDIESMKNVMAPRIAIIQHPDVRRMLMRQRAIVEGGRALAYFAAYCYDMSEAHPDQEERERHLGFLELLTPVVKAWCTDMGFDASISAIQTYGGYGYTADYPVEQFMRDLKVASIYEGTNGVQALDLLGRKMRMKGGMLFMGWIQRMNDFVATHESNTALSNELAVFDSIKNLFSETAMFLGQLGMTGNAREAVLNATPFLMMFGHVSCAYMLLEQAVVAGTKLQNATPADRTFYSNKIRTARFFVNNILPEAMTWAQVIRSGDRSALDFDFDRE